MANEYKFEVGDRVNINAVAYESLPAINRMRLPSKFKSTVFTIARKRRQGDVIQYFIPGYDWQGGTGWINEDWISKWCGGGPLRLTIAVIPEGETTKELMEFTETIKRGIYDAMGIPASELGHIEFECIDEIPVELDKVAE